MDALSIFIIIVSVVLAIVFKWVLFRKIQRWMDQDLIKQLADGDPVRMSALHQQDQQLKQQGIKRPKRHERLQEYARNSEPKAD
ncbi:hypothetical protein [Marinobacterium marinum]|uniref:Uncharacterized protein n=1 Tax=Marinobacterium marinum TaxID=2756129 RepID=A0A7W2AC07_9GAMM|nr:hypothetical protein [Marinobacterium marinum]MBA4501989.1 hypothetical protein [Marinobacterium marinum]